MLGNYLGCLSTLFLFLVYLIKWENGEVDDLFWKKNVEENEVDQLLIAWKSDCGHSFEFLI